MREPWYQPLIRVVTVLGFAFILVTLFKHYEDQIDAALGTDMGQFEKRASSHTYRPVRVEVGEVYQIPGTDPDPVQGRGEPNDRPSRLDEGR